jgi:hypothetical protein
MNQAIEDFKKALSETAVVRWIKSNPIKYTLIVLLLALTALILVIIESIGKCPL